MAILHNFDAPPKTIISRVHRGWKTVPGHENQHTTKNPVISALSAHRAQPNPPNLYAMKVPDQRIRTRFTTFSQQPHFFVNENCAQGGLWLFSVLYGQHEHPFQ